MHKLAILTVGVSASGKTTWAKAHCQRTYAVNINRDDLRFSLTGATGWHEYSFVRKTEDMVTRLQKETIRIAAEQCRDVVISDTNMKQKTRSDWILFLKELGYTVQIKAFPIGLDDAIRRDFNRGVLKVGKDVIEGQYKQWQQFYKEYDEHILY